MRLSLTMLKDFFFRSCDGRRKDQWKEGACIAGRKARAGRFAGNLALLLVMFALVSPVFAASASCVVGSHVLVEPGNHPATVLAASAVSCRVHYEDHFLPDSWTYNYNLSASAQKPLPNLCVPGAHVLVSPGDHPATVLSASKVSCRLHYDDHAYPDRWTEDFNLKSATPPASGPPGSGRYDVTAGDRNIYDGYLMLQANGGYEYFLPGGRSAGTGRFEYDAASGKVRWLSGPLKDPGWDGTQQVEHADGLIKIRIGRAAVATFLQPK